MTANAEAQALALDILHGALSAAVNARRRVPCRVPGHGAAWTSDAYEERAEAAEHCDGCVIWDACRDAGESAGLTGGRATFGVYAAHDYARGKRP